jgi:hypothetical protein
MMFAIVGLQKMLTLVMLTSFSDDDCCRIDDDDSDVIGSLLL